MILKQIETKFELKLMHVEILAIVDSVSNSDKKMYCEITALRAHFPSSVGHHNVYRCIRELLRGGYLEKAGALKKKYQLVLTGSGDYVLREYSKLIHQAIREREGKQAKRLKYSFFNPDHNY